jgi:hypothetical protein
VTKESNLPFEIENTESLPELLENEVYVLALFKVLKVHYFNSGNVPPL